MAISPMTKLELGSRPRNLSEVVFEAIHQAIVDKVLEPGDPVTEPDLAERLNVSKTPVREALLRLRDMGLLEQAGPRGLRVIQPSRESLRHAYEMREVLEAFTARRAAENATPEARERILDAARRSLEAAKTEDVEEFRRNDREFHALIADQADNPRVGRLISDIGALIATLLQRDLPTGEGATRCGEEHVQLANVIAAADGEAAAGEMTAHIRHVWQLALASMATADEGP